MPKKDNNYAASIKFSRKNWSCLDPGNNYVQLYPPTSIYALTPPSSILSPDFLSTPHITFGSPERVKSNNKTSVVDVAVKSLVS